MEQTWNKQSTASGIRTDDKQCSSGELTMKCNDRSDLVEVRPIIADAHDGLFVMMVAGVCNAVQPGALEHQGSAGAGVMATYIDFHPI